MEEARQLARVTACQLAHVCKPGLPSVWRQPARTSEAASNAHRVINLQARLKDHNVINHAPTP